MAAWPASLPQGFLRGFKVRPVDNVLRTEMDVGLAKVRRRSTYTALEVEGEIVCTQSQVEALELFYLETTKSGTERFSIQAPHTDRIMDARFREPPQFGWIGGLIFQCSISLELTITSLSSSNAIWPEGDAWIWPDGSRAIWPRTS